MRHTKIALTEGTDGKVSYAAWLAGLGDTNGEQQTRLRRALKYALERELTERQRKWLLLYYFEGWRITEIAEIDGVNKSTVSKTIRRARERLQKVLQYSIL